MAFSGDILYYARFAGRDGVKTYQVEIRKEGYAGTASEIIELAPSPLSYKHIDVEDSFIQGSEMVFRFMCRRADYATYDLLSQGSDFEYMFQVYDLADTFRPLWTGFVIPAETSRAFFSNIVVYTFTATDYLSRLKDYLFSDLSGNIPVGRMRAIDAITLALYKIPGGGKFISCQTGIQETHMTGVGPGMSKSWIYPRIFTKKKNQIVTAENCYNIITEILKVYNLRLCSPFININDFNSTSPTERFFILSNDEVSSPIWSGSDSDDDGDVVFDKTRANNCLINIDDYKFNRDSELSRELVVKAVDLLQHNYDFGAPFSEENISDLANTENWIGYNIQSVSTLNGITTFVVLNNMPDANFVSLDTFVLISPNSNSFIRVSFTIKSVYYNTYNTTQCTPFVRITDMTTNTSKVDHLKVLYIWNTIVYVSPITSVFEITDGHSYKVAIGIDNPSGFSHKIEISNIVFSTIYANNGSEIYNVIFDDLFTATSVDSATSDLTIETKIGDSQKENNKSAITFSNNDDAFTNSWYRYGKIETKSIQELALQAYFNSKGGQTLKITVYDENDTISLKNMVQFDGVTYKILDLERDIIKGVVSLRLRKLNTSDVALTIVKTDVSSESSTSGSSSSTSSGGTPSVITMKHNNLSGLAWLSSGHTGPSNKIAGFDQYGNPSLKEPAANGQDGSDGLSAYEIAVGNGYTGTEVQWLESLKADGGWNIPGAVSIVDNVLALDCENKQSVKFEISSDVVDTLDVFLSNISGTYFIRLSLVLNVSNASYIWFANSEVKLLNSNTRFSLDLATRELNVNSKVNGNIDIEMAWSDESEIWLMQVRSAKDGISYDLFAELPYIGCTSGLYFVKANSTFYTWNGTIYVPTSIDVPEGALTTDITSGSGWNASTNNPSIASGIGTEGDFAMIATAGTTTIDGISSWGVGDVIWWDADNSVWRKIDNQDNSNSFEKIANKVSAFQPIPDNMHYVSEKLMYDQLASKAGRNWLDSGQTSGISALRVAAFGASGASTLLETILASVSSVAGFVGDYAGLATESNWTNNLCTSVAGNIDDFCFGQGSSGCSYYCYYTQFGWNRYYTNKIITNSTLIASLTTIVNWTKVNDTIWAYNASAGDIDQEYYYNGYDYRCINGAVHTWIRIGNLDTVTITDTAYIPKPQVELGKADNATFVIPAKYEIRVIYAEAETTTSGNLSIGTSDGATDVVGSTAIPTTIGNKVKLTVSSPDAISTSRTLCINISSVATVKLHIVLQKIFE
jgi:hypothetical protein